MELHSKMKGAVGELAVAKVLMEQGIPVFKELGDLAKVDLIALVGNTPVKIQVKAATSKDGTVTLYSTKSGPGYQFRYEEGMVDVFAVHVLDTQQIFFVSSEELLSHKRTMTFRVAESRQASSRYWSDYSDFKRVLRDCEPNSLTGNAEGEDTVQTATEMSG